MTKRPRSHVLEDQAAACLCAHISDTGWIVEPLGKDYGEDFLVRIFKNETATEFGFFIQSKATDSLHRYLSKDGSKISFPIETKHIRHWERFWEPVVVTLYDAKTKIVYWQIVQSWFQRLSQKSRANILEKSTVILHIPTSNQINKKDLSRVEAITERRFKRFELEQQGAKILIQRLEDNLGLKIEYNAQNGIIMIPSGKFVTDNDGSKVVFFGKMASMVEEITARTNKTPLEILTDGINGLTQAIKGMNKLEAKRFLANLHDDDA